MNEIITSFIIKPLPTTQGEKTIIITSLENQGYVQMPVADIVTLGVKLAHNSDKKATLHTGAYVYIPKKALRSLIDELEFFCTKNNL